MKIKERIKLNFDDVLLVPQRSTLKSRKDVVLEREFKFYHSAREWSGIPIMTSNMPPVCSLEMYKTLCQYKMITCLDKYKDAVELDDYFNKIGGDTDYCWVSMGFSQKEINRIYDFFVLSGLTPNIVIDVPNGYLETFVQFCSKVRNKFPESIIMAGNVTTSEMVQELIIHGGVDIVKIQIGPGSMCDTRKKTGVGYGTLSAIDECSSSAHGLKSDDKRLGLVCSDGGVKTSGDVCKAFGANADFVMMFGMFAGAEECDGEWVYETKAKNIPFFGKNPNFTPVPSIEKFKTLLKCYGMSSHFAQEKHEGIKKDYRASEGKVTMIPYKGPVKDIIQELLGGIRSSATYIGANSLKDFGKCAEFVRIT